MPTSSDARITRRRAIRRGSSPRGDHASQPVETGVDVGAADALDERGEDVVVLVVAVAQRAQRQGGFGVGERDGGATGFRGQGRGDVE
jgi:hypothetical protein